MPAIKEARQNGRVATGADDAGPDVSAAPPRVQRREAWLDLPAPYAGFKVKVWVNFPSQALDDAADESDPVLYAAAMGKIVLEHNGWQDFDGTPYPPPDTVAFWQHIPNELARTIGALIRRESEVLPNSVLRTRPR